LRVGRNKKLAMLLRRETLQALEVRMNEDTQTIPVRIPKSLALALKDLQSQENLPSLGAALKVYIDRVQSEALEKRISKGEKKIKEIQNTIKHINETMKIFIDNSLIYATHNNAFSLILEKQIINKLSLDEKDSDDLLAAYAYERQLDLVRRQFELAKHTRCGYYEWVKRQIEMVNKPSRQKRAKDSKDSPKKASGERVK